MRSRDEWRREEKRKGRRVRKILHKSHLCHKYPVSGAALHLNMRFQDRTLKQSAR